MVNPEDQENIRFQPYQTDGVEKPEDITTLRDIFAHQDYLQTVVYGNGISPRDFDGINRQAAISFYSVNHVALIDELHEALAEVGWKPWASSDHFNKDAVKGELVDALHFLVNLCLVSGITADDLIAGYKAKSAINEKRQQDGYDGVSTKCGLCKRALDDTAVECYVQDMPNGIEKYCAVEKRTY